MLKRMAVSLLAALSIAVPSFATQATAQTPAFDKSQVSRVIDTNDRIMKPPSTKGSKPIAKNKQSKAVNHGLPVKDPNAPRTLAITREYTVGSLANASGTGFGTDANAYISNPFVSSLDGASGHSIYQLYHEGSTGEGIEFGVRKPYAGGNAKVFAGYRKVVGGVSVFQGYNVGVNLYPGYTGPAPGDDVPAADFGTTKKFTVQYDSVGTCGTGGHPWALGYGGVFQGFICSDLFTAGSSMRAGVTTFVQYFSENTIDSAATHAGFFCSDAGNGVAVSGASAQWGSARILGVSTANPPTDFTVYTDPASPPFSRTTVNKLSTRTWKYNSMGSNSTNTAIGTGGAC